ncbi:MAG: carboxypeptidase-like regulatory domain-containing protein, partial [bacterium]
MNNRKKRFTKIMLMLFIFRTIALNAEIKRTAIQGQIINAESKEPLAYANVMIEHTTIGTAADENGFYQITNIPTGRIHLIATMMGFKRGSKIVSVEKEQIITVNFELKSTILELGTVVI